MLLCLRGISQTKRTMVVVTDFQNDVRCFMMISRMSQLMQEGPTIADDIYVVVMPVDAKLLLVRPR